MHGAERAALHLPLLREVRAAIVFAISILEALPRVRSESGRRFDLLEPADLLVTAHLALIRSRIDEASSRPAPQDDVRRKRHGPEAPRKSTPGRKRVTEHTTTPTLAQLLPPAPRDMPQLTAFGMP